MPDSGAPAASDGGGGPLGLLAAVAIGVGGMIGGGIFAVLGLAVGVGGGGTFVAFFIAGMVALVTTYSYARLSVAIPSSGGTVAFVNEAFGGGRVAGALSVLLWLSYIVTVALYAFAFGSYATTFVSASDRSVGLHVMITAVVVVMTAVNVFSAKLIGATEKYIVAAKVAILVAFVAVALFHTDFATVAPSQWPGAGSLLAGGMLIFVAYEGFELIANAAGDAKDPKRTIPRALYVSVTFTVVLYVLVAIVTVGLLPLGQIAAAADFALAEAAGVVWGRTGFDAIVVAALLSTASAINATLYGTSRLTVVIAVDGEAPTALERKIAGKPILGLLLTAGAALLVANVVPLEAISSLASAGFLIVFAAVNVANVKLARRTNSRRWISVVAACACTGALMALMAHLAATRPIDLLLLVGLLVATFVGEATYERRRRRRPPREDQPGRGLQGTDDVPGTSGG